MKILLADDEPSLCEALSIILRDAGYEVRVARDGAQAVTMFARERPDLAILDVMMPKLDGFDACESIREIDPDVPVLMLTAKGDIDDKRRRVSRRGRTTTSPSPSTTRSLSCALRPCSAGGGGAMLRTGRAGSCARCASATL